MEKPDLRALIIIVTSRLYWRHKTASRPKYTLILNLRLNIVDKSRHSLQLSFKYDKNDDYESNPSVFYTYKPEITVQLLRLDVTHNCILRVIDIDIILQLVKSKCVPVLLYGLEACALNKSQIGSLDFVINRFFMKLLKTK